MNKAIFVYITFTILLLLSTVSHAQVMQVSSGKLITLDRFESQYVSPRTIRIWLPDNFSQTQSYALIIMHDGQMLFDASSTWNKQEWGADEVAQTLIDEGKVMPFIIVGVDNISGLRHAEYFPQAPFLAMTNQQQQDAYALQRAPGQLLFGSSEVKSDNYARFLTTELKPYLVANYPIVNDPKHHFLMGASMGGLISWYTAISYPSEYGGVACLSTHWLGGFDPNDISMFTQFYHFLDQQLPMPQQFLMYFDYGDQTLDRHYPKLQRKINLLLDDKQYRYPMTQVMYFPGAEHSEDSWRARLHIPMQFLLSQPTLIER